MSTKAESDVSLNDGPGDGLFKSVDFTVHKFNEATNSAVSELPLEHAQLTNRAGPHVDASSAELEASPPVSTEPPAGEAVSALASPDAEPSTVVMQLPDAVASAEKCIAELDGAMTRAQELVAEVRDSIGAMSIGDELRERIRQTIARSQSLRRNI